MLHDLSTAQILKLKNSPCTYQYIHACMLYGVCERVHTCVCRYMCIQSQKRTLGASSTQLSILLLETKAP